MRWSTRSSKRRGSKFKDLPGVEVVGAQDDVNAQAKKKRLPAVMVTGRIRKLKALRDGTYVVYSASVEYVMHRMPDQALLGHGFRLGQRAGFAPTRLEIANAVPSSGARCSRRR